MEWAGSVPWLIRGLAARHPRVTRRISPATTLFRCGWEERAGEGVKSCFFKKKKKKTTTKNPGPFDGSNPGSLGVGRDVPGLAHALPTEGLGCFKCIVF